YCGEKIKVEPEHIDDGLARFRYTFPDESVYHLNMFPLRKNYMRRLLREVGFQRIETYGDFQSTYSDGDPDFFIHIAEKIYRSEEQAVDLYSNAVNTARDYYNSEDADSFYAVVWGGEDIHVGMYADESEEISVASRRTVESMADLGELSRESGVLDLGAGYGGAARYLASTYGCRVTCLNLSEVENARNRRLNAEQGLEELIEVVDGSFEDVPFQDNAFDVVWSQDSLLHSGDRARVLEEAVRVLRPGGQMIFTDPMATERANKEDLKLILQRLQLDTLATPSFYQRELLRLGVRSVDFHDHSEQLPRHYQRVYDELVRRKPELAGRVSDEYCTRMQTGLQYWVQGGKAGNLAWGIFHARN
ncbi:MAG TPA: methyltransferase domain-containing protein, partial [Pseudonocardiaceae bacterium]|nr:methyltransferase domain-containing protein [Pseudonocardiaceae bacterium]